MHHFILKKCLTFNLSRMLSLLWPISCQASYIKWTVFETNAISALYFIHVFIQLLSKEMISSLTSLAFPPWKAVSKLNYNLWIVHTICNVIFFFSFKSYYILLICTHWGIRGYKQSPVMPSVSSCLCILTSISDENCSPIYIDSAKHLTFYFPSIL